MADQVALLYEAFTRCDLDQDGRLNQGEFMHFCESGLGKPQENGSMYKALCVQLGVDADVGVLWNDISVMFAASNTEHDQSLQAPVELSDQSSLPDHYRGTSLSYSQENARHDRNTSASIEDYDDMSQTSERESRPHHGRGFSGLPGLMKRDSSMAELAIIEALQGSNEAQSKKLKEMSKKVRHLNKKNAALERDKTHANDQNQHLNTQIAAMQHTLSRVEQEKSELHARLQSERNRYEEKIRLLQNQLDDDRKTITHLEGQHQQAQQERDQVLQLFKNAETQFEVQHTTLKRKHKEQLEKVSVGFLQSLGAQPGEDIRQIVRDLRDDKRQLSQQVSMLAEQLTRKDRSLYDALQTIDVLTTQQKFMTLGRTGRRPSRSATPASGGASPTPGGEDFTRDRPVSPDFFIQAMSDGGGASRRVSGPSTVSASQSNAHRPVGPEGQVKQYQFVANAMTAQVVRKEEEIENLRAANEVLGMQINEQNKS